MHVALLEYGQVRECDFQRPFTPWTLDSHCSEGSMVAALRIAPKTQLDGNILERHEWTG